MKHLPLLLAVCAAGGCCLMNQDRWFKGDGTLRNRGCWPFENYALDLGAVDVGASGRLEHHFSGLPSLQWVVGFSVPRRKGDPTCAEMRQEPWTVAVVDVTLEDGSGMAPRFHDTAPLRDWTWTWSGPEPEECQAYSRSSYFTPRREERFLLTIAVTRPVAGARAIHGEARTTAVYSP